MVYYFIAIAVLFTSFSHSFYHPTNGLRYQKFQVPIFMKSPANYLKTVASLKKDDIYFYNTLSRQKEKFVSQKPGKVSFYSCGPTVYDFAHIGNFRAFLTYDLIKRWLQYCGYDVDHVCNLTDVDDKIIVKMLSDGMTLQQVTDKYSNVFFDDLNVLNIRLANSYPRVTQYIEEIKSMIDSLIQKKYAYTSNGSVYFRVDSLPTYSKLTNINTEEMKEGAGGSGPNTRRGSTDKEDNKDFVLWKSFIPQDGEVAWSSPFGKGRPGWHIECSAMCCKLLGETIDIHAGGVDLVFPHHQNEIMQSEAYSGKIYSKYWMHNGFVNINNEKMSKSLKNFKTLRDIATTPFEARAFRFLVITSQYRSPLNFNPDTMKAAIQGLKRIDKVVNKLQQLVGSSTNSKSSNTASNNNNNNNNNSNNSNSNTSNNNNSVDDDGEIKDEACKTVLNNFEKAMSDDMNTPRATAELFALVSTAEKIINNISNNSEENSKSTEPVVVVSVTIMNQIKDILQSIQIIDEIFGVFYTVPTNYFTTSTNSTGNDNSNNNNISGSGNSAVIPGEVLQLAKQRYDAKVNKQFDEADRIRVQITALGYTVKDKKGGSYDVLPVENS